MKLKRLFIRNINSLKGDHEIDFQSAPLKDAGLIGIVGKTGAGKSTLLDAITLALFNRIPRMSSKMTGDFMEQTGSILTRGEISAMTEVDFEVLENNVPVTYRSKWTLSTVSRGKRRGQINDYHMEVWNLESNKQISDKKGKVPELNEKLIGLSFDQFVKSVMLSQGQFTAFLSANEKDRSALLEKITRSFDFREISIKVYQQYKMLDEQYKRLKTRVDEVQPKSEEELQEVNSQIKMLNEEISNEKKNRDYLFQGVDHKKRIEANQLNIKEKKNELKAYQQEEVSINNIRKKVEAHERLLPILPVYQEWKNQKESLYQVEQKKGSIEKQLVENQNKQSVQNALFTSASKETQQLNQEWEKANLLWKEVDELDRNIQLKKESVYHLNEQKDTSVKRGKTLEQSEIELTEKLTHLRSSLQSDENWGLEHQSLSTLEDDLPLIRSHVSQKQKLDSNFEEAIHIVSVGIQQKLSPLTYSQKKETIEGWEKSGKATLKTLEGALKYPDLPFEVLDDRIQLFDSYEKQLQLIQEQERQIQVLTLEQENIQTRKKSNEERLLVTQKESDYLKVLIEELEVKVRRLSLESSENIEKLRSQLIEGEACMVCGSVHHPYAHETSSKDELKEVEHQLVISKKEYQEKLKNHQTELSTKAKIEATVESLLLQKNKLNIDLNEFKEEGKSLVLKINQLDIPPDKQSAKEFQDEKSRILEIQSKKKGLEEISTLYQIVLQIVEIDKELTSYITKYNKYVATENDWEQLVALKTKWDDKQQLIKEYPKLILEKEEQKAQNKKLISDHLLEVQKLNNDISDVNSNLEYQGKERHRLFGEKEIEKERAVLLDKKTEQDRKVRQIELELSKLKAEILSFEKQVIDYSKEEKSISTLLLESKSKLDLKLASAAITLSSFENGLLEENEYQELSLKVKHYDNALTALNSSLETLLSEVGKAISEDKFKEQTLEQLQDSFAEQEIKIQSKETELRALETEISLNNEKVKELEETLKKISTMKPEYDLWKTMNTLIGSSNGDEFNKFAQSIVLRKLLHKANHHLKKFTDRYLFAPPKVNGTQDLYILDRYAGDKERVVSSVSGGESFLLSLSLSLGLADLASNNVKVESLFIDEGFGTLDEEALDQAISALEKLNDLGGKTISVISHVPQIKERVPAKIQVISNGSSGHSKIEVTQ
ncbi:AAA family ATPase [Flammeovirga agarivorans]|uniref:AAA family ATPase n=1 Tax=Flammeovirga agarivorans TaxID=2726742 RepID=A0A7X8SIR9_9BACT|nr:AAA family ATPase [Flammeovirga agarivorans]NLR90877.1 AAA family ATPase [Flammeovirga agarivorans]